MRTQDFNFGQEFERIFGTFKQDTIKINGSQSGTTKKKFQKGLHMQNYFFSFS